MKNTFFLFLTLFAVAGCSRRVIPVASDTTIVRTERVIDTLTRVVRDSSLLTALLECDSLGRVRIADLRAENSRLVSQNLLLQDNLLSVLAAAESQERVRIEVVRDTTYIRREVPVPYPAQTNRLRGWQKVLLWIGLFYLVRCGVRIARNWKQITFKTLLKLL